MPGFCKILSQSIGAFITTWTQSTTAQQTQNVERLLNAIKQRTVLEGEVSEGDKQVALENQAEMELQSTPDVPLINSRQAMFIFLSSLVRSWLYLHVIHAHVSVALCKAPN
jgi:hypothetical protein